MTVEEIRATLNKANAAFNKTHPGDPERRQPMHTVYGGAQLFKHDVARKITDASLKAMKEYAPDARTFARAFGWTDKPAAFSEKIYQRVMEKLQREAVEDFRIDFEDGFGIRPDAEEDAFAVSCAQELAKGMREKTLPPFIGIRVKPCTEELSGRSLKTTELFMNTLLKESGGKLPEGFVITLAKITIPEQVWGPVKLLSLIESKNGLAPGTIKIELMVETPQSIISGGEIGLPRQIAAAEGRCIGAHFGTYDYTASCGITAAHQHMRHQVCDFAKHVMQVSLAGTGVMLSDGATNIMPVGSPEAVYRAWKLSYDDIRHSLVNGFYQGWDLHPAQLPARYAAVYSFFLESLEPASVRLKNFVDKATQATLVGDVFDDAATGQGLLAFFLKGISSGAITEDEACATGLTVEEIRGRSFVKILNNRRQRARG